MINQNLTERQLQVLQCLKDAKNDKKMCYRDGVVHRMKAKGFSVTPGECLYDLRVLVKTKNTGVISMRLGNRPSLWIFDPKTILDSEHEK